MRALLPVGLALSLAILGPVAFSQAPEQLRKRDQQGPVTAVLTLMPAAPGAPIKAKIVLDTHSVGLDGIVLDQAVAKTEVGSEVELMLLRDGKEQAVKVRLGELPEGPQR